MSTGRRTNKTFGYVNFPVDDPWFENTKEGGMFVKLIAISNRQSESVCCGTENTSEFLSEVLVNDDIGSLSIEDPDWETISQKELLEYNKKVEAREKKYFPFVQSLRKNTDISSTTHYYLSVPLLASVLLGSTGWSGFNKKTEETWFCTYDDLTKQGKDLYNQIKQLFPSAEIRLLTYLDT